MVAIDMHRLIPGHGPDPWTREAFGCGFYPGPGHAPPAPQDRLRNCSLATVDPHRTGDTRNTAVQRNKCNGLKQRPEHHASRVDGKLLTELLGRTLRHLESEALAKLCILRE